MIAAGISNPPGSRACDVGGSCGVPGLIAVPLHPGADKWYRAAGLK